MLRSAFFLTSTLYLLISCSSATDKTTNIQHPVLRHHKHAAERYACPHHPEHTGKKGDHCPACGMLLTKIDDDVN